MPFLSIVVIIVVIIVALLPTIGHWRQRVLYARETNNNEQVRKEAKTFLIIMGIFLLIVIIQT